MAPTGRLTVSAIVDAPDAEQVAPEDATQVQVTPVSTAGGVSAIATPVALDGPAFEATIVYVTAVPAIVKVDPSVLVIFSSARWASVSVSVKELFPGNGSVTPEGTATVAVLASVPLAVDAIVAVSV